MNRKSGTPTGIMGISATGNDDLSITASYMVRVVRRLT